MVENRYVVNGNFHCWAASPSMARDLWASSNGHPREGTGYVSVALAPEPDDINHPSHYTQGSIEPIDVIEDWDLPYHLGNVIKYIARYRFKGSSKKDLDKASWYLKRFVDKYDG